MWIMTQTKNRIVNSDLIIDIFIDRTGTKVLADTADTNEALDFVTLGVFKDREDCQKILEVIMSCINDDIVTLEIPLGGNIDDWYKLFF